MIFIRRMAVDPRVMAVAVAVAMVILLRYGATDGFRATKVAQFFIFALVYLSLVVITGMSGVVSLLSATLLGFGAFSLATLVTKSALPFLLAVPVSATITAALCIAVGVPVLRLRASAFIVMTLGFIALIEGVVFTNDWCCGGGSRGVPAPRPDMISSDQRYMAFCATVLVVIYLFTRAWRDSRVGRAIVATRDNPAAAEVLGVNVVKARLAAFGISGFLVGTAGALYAGMLESVDNQGGAFGIDRGIEFFGFAMVGGITSLAGPIIAASLRVLSQLVLDESQWREHTGLILLAIAGPGTLVVYRFAPDGLAGILGRWIRGQVSHRDEFRENSHAADPVPIHAVATDHASVWQEWPGGARLRCRNISCNFGGLQALDDVSIDVTPGEIVGLLGTNGAGKSTFINAVSGLAPPTRGRMVLDVPGHDGDAGRRYELGNLLPYQRAAVGIGRTFQDVRLFPGLSCVDNLLIAGHHRHRRGLLANGLRLPSGRREEAASRRDVDAVLDLVDLGPFADATPDELSYGTLRMLELAAMLVLRPRLLLLDEPASGVAEAEARALVPLLLRVRERTGVSMILVEHDVALVATVADRIVGMDAGRVLIDGTPDEVLSDDAMIAAYLGTDEGSHRAESSRPVGAS